LLAAKVAERSAETGEHYITRTPAEYRAMVGKAAGGGAVMAFTTLVKFGLYALALSAFWGGFLAGVNYALSFVLIQLLHFTVATKQPAMTAPAMAAKLKELDSDSAVQSFVDEVTHLVRSQVAAVLGNVLVVYPAALLGPGAGVRPGGSLPQRGQGTACARLAAPARPLGAVCGIHRGAAVCVQHRRRVDGKLVRPAPTGLGPALQPAHHALAGCAAGRALGRLSSRKHLRLRGQHLARLHAGLTPAVAGFFGLGLDVRHVTLSSGQLGAATASLGLQGLQTPAFWWAALTLPLLGALNVGSASSWPSGSHCGRKT
jgi:site-specific recombinase